MKRVDQDSSRIRDTVRRARQWLAEGREQLQSQHHEGTPGIQLCTRQTELLDSVVLEIFEGALASFGAKMPEVRSQIALVPYGGYGRREMAPYSDVDLMLLHTPASLSLVTPLAQQLVRDVSDTGLKFGFSVRTVQDACQLSAQDGVVFCSLVDSRFLGGSVRLYAQFARAFPRLARRRSAALLDLIQDARREECTKYGEAGETVYLLEPNIKRSPGGLRDLQMLRWVGFARYGEANPEHLQRLGHLSAEDYGQLRHAQEYLLRLRNELHFRAQCGSDVLYRNEQLRLAECYGFPGQEGLLPVEQFMREYFHHTSSVRQIVDHFVAGAQLRHVQLKRAIAFLTSHQVDGLYRVGQTQIAATRRGLVRITSSLAEVLRLMDLSGRYNCSIDHPTWRAIREALMARQDLAVDREAAARFLSFLSQPNRLGQLLRRLHELRALEKLVPGYDHARCLLQFNEYHKYTVDEHSIRSVERATEFLQGDGAVSRAYRDIKHKQLLHLALLVHDLGKGFVEDHSEVGARIALQVAQTLYLNEGDTETLRFLVHRHLMLSHLAFRRDTSDESILLQHVAEIGSPALLKMLFVLTCADLAAVGPGVLNQWKLEVLTDLYQRMMDYLSGGAPTAAAAERLAQKRQRLIGETRSRDDADWYRTQVEQLPAAYLEGPTSDAILADLARLRHVSLGEVVAWGRYLPDRKVVEYSVAAYEDLVPGIFHRLTGALTGHGLEILAAEIHSLADRLCLDRFYVRDNDYSDEPPAERFAAVTQTLNKVLLKPSANYPTFRRLWQPRAHNDQIQAHQLPTRVRVDNATSDRFTIIDVFTVDRPGLLYLVTRTLFDLELSVVTARIGTHLDQVVDVFYVTDNAGQKLPDSPRLQHIHHTLLEAIARFQTQRSTED